MGRYNYPADLLDELKALSRRLEDFERGNQLQNSTVTIVVNGQEEAVPITDLAYGTRHSLTSYEHATVLPTASPTPTVEGNIASFHVSWAPVYTTEETVIELHMSSDPNLQAVPGDERSLVAEVQGTMYTVRTDIDGSDLIYEDVDETDPDNPVITPHTYYFQTIAKTGAGATSHSATVAATLRQINTPDISVNAAWVGTMTVDRLLGSELFAEMVISGGGTENSGIFARGAAGEEVSMKGSGLQVKGPTALGNPVYVDMPTDGTEPSISLRSARMQTVEIDGDPVTGQALNLRGASTIANGAELRMASIVSAPISAPIISVENVVYDMYGANVPESKELSTGFSGGYYDTATGHTYFASNTDLAVYWMTAAGQVVGRVQLPKNGELKGITRIGDTWYLLWLGMHPSFGISWWIEKRNTSWTILDNWLAGEYSGTGSRAVNHNTACIGNDGTNILFGRYNASNSLVIDVFATTSSGNASPTTTYVSNMSWGDTSAFGPLRGLIAGDFDYGAQRYIILQRTQVLVFSRFNNSLSRQIDNGWPIPFAAASAMIWDGTRMWCVSGNTLQFAKHSLINWTVDPSTWYVSNTRVDTVPVPNYETTQSPKNSFTMRRRSWLRVTASYKGAPSSRIYVGRGLSVPIEAAMYRQAELTGGITGHLLDQVTFSGNSVPTSSNWPSVVPAQIISEDGATYWKADGSAKLSKLIVSSPTDLNASAGNEPALRIGNILGNHMRMDGNEIQSMDGDAAVGTLFLQQNGGVTKIGVGSHAIATIRFNNVSVDTNASGLATITHGCGGMPTVVMATSRIGAAPSIVTVLNITDTTFQVEIANHAGTLVANASRQISWLAIR